MQSFVGESERFSVDVNAVADVFEKGSRTLLNDVLNSQPHFDVLGETLDEGQEVLR